MDDVIVPRKQAAPEPTTEPAHALVPEQIAEDADLGFDETVN
jgi:hypothetical protein